MVLRDYLAIFQRGSKVGMVYRAISMGDNKATYQMLTILKNQKLPQFHWK